MRTICERAWSPAWWVGVGVGVGVSLDRDRGLSTEERGHVPKDPRVLPRGRPDVPCTGFVTRTVPGYMLST